MKARSLAFVLCLLSATALWAAPSPEEILRASLTAIGKAQNIRVEAVIMNDTVIATGQKLQHTTSGTIDVRRPDGLRIALVADNYRRNIQYDGKVLAVSDPDRKFYATFDAPPTLDATVVAVKQKLQLDLPLSQLFATDAAATLGSRAKRATYVGLNRVGGVMCHHLAFVQDNVDWQIWIADDQSRLPRKVVIDHKNRAGRPQYIAILSNWNLAARFDGAAFRFVPPSGAQKIDFVTEVPR